MTNGDNAKKLTGIEKASILMLALEEEYSVEVFKHLSSQEIQEVSRHMATVDQVSHDAMNQVLDSFFEESEQFSMFSIGSADYLRTVLSKVMGNDRASTLLEDIMETAPSTSGIDSLNLIEASTVAETIRDEHPQIIATILVHLDRAHARDVLNLFPERQRDEVMLRITTFSGVQPAALEELTEVLTGMFDGQNLKRSKMGGVKTAAEILNLMNSSVEEQVLNTVRDYSEDLAQRVQDEMFVFQNLLELDDPSIKLILKEVEANSLALALKGESEDLRNKFTRNMSQRAAQLLLEDMEAHGRVRVSQMEAEQKEILQVVRRLAESGDIELVAGEDSYV